MTLDQLTVLYFHWTPAPTSPWLVQRLYKLENDDGDLHSLTMSDQGKPQTIVRRRLTSLLRVLTGAHNSKSSDVSTPSDAGLAGNVASTHRASLNGWRRRRSNRHQEDLHSVKSSSSPIKSHVIDQSRHVHTHQSTKAAGSKRLAKRMAGILGEPPDFSGLEDPGPVFGAPLERQIMSASFYVSSQQVNPFVHQWRWSV